MTRSIVTALTLALTLTSSAFAQSTRTDQIETQKEDKATDLQPPTREKGDVVVTKLENVFMPAPPAVRPNFGDFRPGAGFALGAGYEMPVGERGLWTGSGALSVKQFKELETAMDVPPMTTDRVRVRTVARWEDAPDLRFFGLGTGASLGNEVTYGLRSTELGGEVRAKGRRWLGYGGGVSLLRVQSSDGTGDVPSTGASTSTEWWHTTAYGEIDSRHSPGYTDTGGLYRVAFHDYGGRDGAPNFTRAEIDLRQFVPVLHDNWIVALQARADLTSSASGQVIPFFMLPSIGGRDTLPGFTDYRFTDKDSLLLRSELRWTPSPVLDMAVFFDQGTVAASTSALDLHDLKRGWGIGARLHGPTYTALRLEVAHSVEGWRYNIAQGISF